MPAGDRAFWVQYDFLSLNSHACPRQRALRHLVKKINNTKKQNPMKILVFVVSFVAASENHLTCADVKRQYSKVECCGEASEKFVGTSGGLSLTPFVPYPPGSRGEGAQGTQFSVTLQGTWVPQNVDSCPGFTMMYGYMMGLFTDTNTTFPTVFSPQPNIVAQSYFQKASALFIEITSIEKNMGVRFENSASNWDANFPYYMKPEFVVSEYAIDEAYLNDLNDRITAVMTEFPSEPVLATWNDKVVTVKDYFIYLLGIHGHYIAYYSNMTSAPPTTFLPNGMSFLEYNLAFYGATDAQVYVYMAQLCQVWPAMCVFYTPA